MQALQMQCFAVAEDDVTFETSEKTVVIIPSIEDASYVCITPAQARRLAKWLDAAAEELDARLRSEGPEVI